MDDTTRVAALRFPESSISPDHRQDVLAQDGEVRCYSNVIQVADEAVVAHAPVTSLTSTSILSALMMCRIAGK
jgi:hypothetical protein